MAKGARRIVTGHDENGKAVVVIDDIVEPEVVRDRAAYFTKIWTTNVSPADNNDPFDGGKREVGLTCPGGTVLRFVDIGPGTRTAMHRTDSLDYGIVLNGAIELELDDGNTVRVEAGDTVVQRGTIHAWVNDGSDWVRMVFFMIDAEPAIVDGKPLPAMGSTYGQPQGK